MTRRDALRLLGAAFGGGMMTSAGPAAPAAGDSPPGLRVVRTGTIYRDGPAIIAGSCRCENGDLLVSFNTGGDLSAGQRVGLSRSTDDGATWTATGHWFESIFTRGGIEAGCSLTRLRSGRLLLPYADGFYLHPGKDIERHALLFCPYSDDNGQTWQGQRAQAFEGLEAFAFGRVVERGDGLLLLPLWGAYDRLGVWASGALKSRDRGETWSEWRPIVREHGDETPILALADGRLLALLRGYSDDPGRPFYVSFSSDEGNNWSTPRRISLQGTAPSLNLTPRGRVLAGFRSTLPGGLCRVALSQDAGLTWLPPLDLQLPADAASGAWDYGGYPVALNLPNGRMLVTFHNGAGPRWHTFYNVVEEL